MLLWKSYGGGQTEAKFEVLVLFGRNRASLH